MMTYEGVDKGKSAHDTTLKELELPPRMTELSGYKIIVIYIRCTYLT